MKPSSTKRKAAASHIYGLDSLRALAITGVTLFHLFPYKIRGGYLGVSLFFVLSGYLLAVSTEKKRRKKAWQASSYYLKRIQRIYPGLIIALTATVGVYYFAARQTIAGIRPELASILFGYNNWWQIAQNADYFTRITNASPFTPMWYLAIEIQFYLIWPVLYAVYIWLRKRRGMGSGLGFILFLTLLSAALTPALYQPGTDVTRLYYGTDTRLYGLLLGVLIGLIQSRRRMLQLPARTARKAALPLFALILAATLAAYVRMDGQKAFAYQGGMILMTVLFGLLLILVTDSRLPVDDWLSLRPLVWLGKNSYEIYLVQYPVIFLFSYKKWSEIPGAFLLEIALILILASWLNSVTAVLTTGKLPKSWENADLFRQIGVFAGTGMTVLVMFTGIAGALTAPAEKFAQKNELAQYLADNQKLLQDMQNSPQGTLADSDTQTSAPGPQEEGTRQSGNGESETGTQEGKEKEKKQGASATETSASDTMNFKYGDPELTNSAPVSTEGVLMIGDSIMLDASPQIKEQLPDSYIDAVQSRQPYEVVDDLQQLIDEGHLNQTVVISLGTNGELYEDYITGVLDVTGPDISVFWINLFGTTVLWDKEANKLLNDMQDKYSNFSVINWRDLIIDHPEWLWEDGEHPNIEGSEVYATLIKESLESAAMKQV